MRAKTQRRITRLMAVALAASSLTALEASPALASTRSCAFHTFVGSYYTWYANCDGNIAVDQASGRYIRQVTTRDGANYYTLTSAPTTTAVTNPGTGEMLAYVGGFVLSFSGAGASCVNNGGNVYYCTWG